MSEAAKNFLSSLWRQCRIGETEVQQAHQIGRITQQERDEILSTPRACD